MSKSLQNSFGIPYFIFNAEIDIRVVGIADFIAFLWDLLKIFFFCLKTASSEDVIICHILKDTRLFVFW